MNQTPQSELDQFDTAMRDHLQRLRRVSRLIADDISRQVLRLGALETAKKQLAGVKGVEILTSLTAPSGEPLTVSWHFAKLDKLRRLDLTIECLALDWKNLFSPEELEAAEGRLRAFNFDPDLERVAANSDTEIQATTWLPIGALWFLDPAEVAKRKPLGNLLGHSYEVTGEIANELADRAQKTIVELIRQFQRAVEYPDWLAEQEAQPSPYEAVNWEELDEQERSDLEQEVAAGEQWLDEWRGLY